MKILILADLHICSKYDIMNYTKLFSEVSEVNDADAIVICGDIIESAFSCNPYKQINNIFRNFTGPIICVLGNHEFFHNDVEEVINYYKYFYNPKKYNVHYLDIIGHYDYGVCRFVGNVLWYDGSMATVLGQNLYEFADKSWNDCTIKNFDWKKENEKCVSAIMGNILPDEKVNILCTHCVPHKDLNLHMNNTFSFYNAFSGMEDLLSDINVDYCFCGHTHRRIVGKYIGKCQCVNVGSDIGYTRWFLIEV